jgi:RNA polymerase sigma factor (sigma-70 family)
MSENATFVPTTRLSVIEGCRQGDNQAWTVFFNIYAPIVYRYARHARLPEHESEEVVAKVMANFLQALRRGFTVDHARGRFRDYLRSAANHEIAACRRRRRPQPVPLDEAPEPSGDEPAAEQRWADLERQERLRLCLARLCHVPEIAPRDLLAFQRYAVGRERADLVAKELNISLSRLYALKHEIIVRLRAMRIELDAILGEV